MPDHPKAPKGLTQGTLLVALTSVVLLTYVVWTIPGVRPKPGFDVWFDGVLQGAGYSLVAIVAALGARRGGATSAAWWSVVAAVVLRAVGFDVTLTTLSLGHPLPYPSVGDAAWMASTLAMLAALGLRLRELTPRLSPLAGLDGGAAALVALGVAITVLDSPLRTLSGEGVPNAAIAVNLGYAVLDTALLVLLSALTALRPRLSASDVVLLGGLLAFVVVDVTFLVLLAEGLWRPGTLLASFSLVATALIAGAVGTSRSPLEHAGRRLGEAPVAELPTGLGTPALLVGLLLFLLTLSGSQIPAVPLALACYAAGGSLALVRAILTVRRLSAEARRAVGEAGADLHLFKSLVEASSELIGMSDPQGRLLYLNPSGRRLLHLPDPQDVTTLSVEDLVPGSGPSLFRARWPRLLDGGSWSGEAELQPVDGSSPVPMVISSFAVSAAPGGSPLVVATVQRDISERRRAELALRGLAEHRAELLHRLVEAQEDERRRIAQDVHDDPVQALAAVDLRLGLLRRRLANEAPGTLPEIDTLLETVSDAMDRLRNLLFSLESLPEGTNLSEAITQAAEFIFTGTDVRCRVVGHDDLPLSEAERVTAHRIVKEALVNVRKHARATHVVVSLALVSGAAVIDVDDDGIGFTPDNGHDRPGHLGLSGMRDRAQAAGASLAVGTRDEGGTRVRLTIS